MMTVLYHAGLITDEDLYLFNEGTHCRLYEKLGAHGAVVDGQTGTRFAVWAPNAGAVSVIGDFNGWQADAHPLAPTGSSGIWHGFIPGVEKGSLFKYHIRSRFEGYEVAKIDPFAFYCETPPKTASIVWDTGYTWGDGGWMTERGRANALGAPIAIYEVHLGSWARVPEENNRSLTYREIAPKLADHVRRTGFTHVELLPIMEHPFFGSWGYQCLGFFAPTSRYGTPQDFMYFVDCLHQNGIGVILDWVPSHFPCDEYGLGYFDGTHLYEHADPRQGIQPDWNSFIFNYGRKEVQSFLISSALFWMDKYHADGLRVDAVASMLYLDYSRSDGGWIPNAYGGKENIDAIEFLRHFNTTVLTNYPDTMTMAEESTDWGMVSRPPATGGLGFSAKWDMGWMHDTLVYITKDPLFRRYHHNQLTFRMLYAYHENFILPLSHDEVTHGKGSLLGKMPGDDRDKFPNYRVLLGYMYAQAGKKLLFMGGEFGQWREWVHEESLEWHLLEYGPHQGLQQWVADLNAFYRAEPALHELDYDPAGFEWVECNDAASSVLSLIRKAPSGKGTILVVCNFTPVLRSSYRVGVSEGGFWRECLNSDGEAYGGNGQGNGARVLAETIPMHYRPYSLNLKLPPLSALFFRHDDA